MFKNKKCLCMCVCLCKYTFKFDVCAFVNWICTCICICIWKCICLFWSSMFIYVYLCVCAYLRMCVCMYACMCVCMHACICVYVLTQVFFARRRSAIAAWECPKGAPLLGASFSSRAPLRFLRTNIAIARHKAPDSALPSKVSHGPLKVAKCRWTEGSSSGYQEEGNNQYSNLSGLGPCWPSGSWQHRWIPGLLIGTWKRSIRVSLATSVASTSMKTSCGWARQSGWALLAQ